MKIGQPATAGIKRIGNEAPSGNESARAGKAGPANAEATGSATVKLSSAAAALLEGSETGFDAAKVDRVRQAIADGTYTINADKIADKLIANAQELLGKASNPSN